MFWGPGQDGGENADQGKFDEIKSGVERPRREATQGLVDFWFTFDLYQYTSGLINENKE
ncbi:MAG: hypothetical protein AAFW66_01280 [Pseudomonadota bacterium]